MIAESALIRQISYSILKAPDDQLFLGTIVDLTDLMMLFVIRLSKLD